MEEGKLHEAILRAMNKLVTDREAVIRMVKQALTAVIGGGGDEIGKAMAIQKRLDKLEQHRLISANANARIEELFRILEEMPSDLMEYDDALTRQTVERITVVDAQTIRIRFYRMGIEVVERVGEDEEPSR